ncbi:MAG: DUF2752 domain-containing protein [Micropruina sp.]|uniref:DUF2752 domain-containing protein n=1 Tax=Micropruina sp. TaxID=2737536 RepID=UPI0039E27796
MSSETIAVKAFDARRGLRSLAAFGAAGVGLSVLSATAGIGVPCPFRSLTGLLCPLCGGTHVGVALLHGDLAAAWISNQFVVVGLGVLTVLGLLWTVEALGGRTVRPPRGLRGRPGLWWTLIGAVALVFAVWRNL